MTIYDINNLNCPVHFLQGDHVFIGRTDVVRGMSTSDHFDGLLVELSLLQHLSQRS